MLLDGWQDRLKKAVNTIEDVFIKIQELEADVEQMQKNNKTLKDEQKAGYKAFNTETHMLIERDTLIRIFNDVADIALSADNVSDEVNSARCEIEEVDSYTIEQAEDSAKYLMEDAQKISNKLKDLLNPEDVQPLAQEGAE